ncbi:DUF4142 domain-containing protein [Streptomyces melanogenes]|uniref:DUF4142 domain-containing protein n=1 Tax=Streptomyces melanogenes TaxID=67326 RepID=UPI00167DD887|nr:DUF4142 domain-containing protein [Streptomyces melanogenes]GGP85734.1 hypothetical protein GCM10010278_75200 [Streptomyces melanogenes]
MFRRTTTAPRGPSAPGRELQIPRPLVTGMIVLGLATTVSALLFPVKPFAESREGIGVATASALADDGQGVVNTPSGPLTPADREFMRRIRLAGLWENPSGQMTQSKSSNPSVKEAGMHLIMGHADLDRTVVQDAQILNVPLPQQPNPQQQGWLNQMNADQGEAFDRDFANLLRSAHGKVFPIVAETRAKTQNTLVRALADQANNTVLDHIGMLEKTGLVNFQSLAK